MAEGTSPASLASFCAVGTAGAVVEVVVGAAVVVGAEVVEPPPAAVVVDVVELLPQALANSAAAANARPAVSRLVTELDLLIETSKTGRRVPTTWRAAQVT